MLNVINEMENQKLILYYKEKSSKSEKEKILNHIRSYDSQERYNYVDLVGKLFGDEVVVILEKRYEIQEKGNELLNL